MNTKCFRKNAEGGPETFYWSSNDQTALTLGLKSSFPVAQAVSFQQSLKLPMLCPAWTAQEPETRKTTVNSLYKITTACLVTPRIWFSDPTIRQVVIVPLFQKIYKGIHELILMSVIQFTHPSIDPCIHPFTRWSMDPSVDPSIHPIHFNIHPVIQLFIHPSIYQFNEPFNV